ncbi:hypothetical protein SOVF_121800 [Spinacia oleracea]|nr:hypothetical protein SOVF_121800 [Spinacia oleracea]
MLLQTRVDTPFTIVFLSAADWKFGVEQFVKMLPDKVHVHRGKETGVLVREGTRPTSVRAMWPLEFPS